MIIELSEIIDASDYDEYAPKVYLGLLLFAGMEAASELDVTKPDGMVSSAEASSQLGRSITATRGLVANVTVKSQFTIWIERLDRIITDPGFTPADRVSAGSYSLPSISGGPPAFDLGELPGAYTFTLESATKTITLKAPEMGNEDRYKPDRVVDENGHRSLRVFKNPTAGSGYSTLSYSFRNLLQSEMEELKTFLVETVGQFLTVTEHSGKVWNAVCTTEDPTFVEELEQRYSITLTFETAP